MAAVNIRTNYPFRNHRQVDALLFDLDGTLIDTAPDLVGALNQLRSELGLPSVPVGELRTEVSAGSRGLLTKGLSLSPNEADFEALRARFLDLYEARQHLGSALFDGFDAVLTNLDAADLPWGIVTNKPARFAVPLLEQLDLSHRIACLVTPDDVGSPKPHPESLFLACSQLKVSPSHALFIGDALNDIVAGRDAGVRTLTALYGYIPEDTNPLDWGSDGSINAPAEIESWI